MSIGDTVARATASARAVRGRRPLVHVMTGGVSAERVADTLLAAGAAPVMAIAPDEVIEVARAADALVINLGALDPRAPAAMASAISAAAVGGVPWALDPVGAGGARARTDAAIALSARRPALIRGNASEILALAGRAGAGRGVDAGDPVEAALAVAVGLSENVGSAVLVSGAVDGVVDADGVTRIAGGDSMMAAVTAMGCALTAYAGALLGTGAAPRAAAEGAAAAFAIAGARAADGAGGPGSFAWRFLDALHALSEAEP